MLSKIYKYEEDVSYNRHMGESYGSIITKINTNSKIIISASHSVKHIRNEKIKSADINTYGIAMLLHELTGVSVISLTGYCNCDPNYDSSCAYKEILKSMIEITNANLFIDLHGSKDRNPYYDICLATDYDKSLLGNMNIKDKFLDNKNFIIEDNTYFSASYSYVLTNYVYNKLHIPSMELELSSTLRCTEKVNLLINHLCELISIFN